MTKRIMAGIDSDAKKVRPKPPTATPTRRGHDTVGAVDVFVRDASHYATNGRGQA